MNAYWENCCLIICSGCRAGLHLPLASGEETFSKVQSLLPSTAINILHCSPEEPLSDEEWPQKSSSGNAAMFIHAAYKKGFENKFRKVVGLFSLPAGLEKKHLEEAFLSIRPLDFCLGSDVKGGLYLLGMNLFEERLINGQPWGQPSLSKSITREIGNLKKIMYKLPVLGQ